MYISDNNKKTKEMEQYEEITGKQAVWRGEITKGFLKWKEGEKDYYSDKKRISVYVSSETERKWQEFISLFDFTSFSKLIRESVNYYINKKSEFGEILFSNLELIDESDRNHILKERLTTIKGFLQLLLEKHVKDLNDDIVSIINNVLNECKSLESKYIYKSEKNNLHLPQYDVLLIEDDPSTIDLVKNYFESRDYSFKGVLTGLKGIEELKIRPPKLILLDIILPDISGFEICKNIKSHELLKDIPVFYLTAVPGSKVEKKMEETKADGYILKPFDLVDLEFLFDYLK
ncbi:MAG: response regulator [Candidatus Lokiarchaeia archaeon]